MSGIECPVCSKIRKIEIISTPDGWLNPSCWNCGDPGWTQPYGEEDPFSGRELMDEREMDALLDVLEYDAAFDDEDPGAWTFERPSLAARMQLAACKRLVQRWKEE